MQLAHDLTTDNLVDELGSLYPVPSLSHQRGNVTFGVQMARSLNAGTLPDGAQVFYGLKATDNMEGPWLALAQLLPIEETPGLFENILALNTPEMIAAMHADPADPLPAVLELVVYGQLFYFLPGSPQPHASQIVPVTVTAVLWNGTEGIAPSPNETFPNAATLNLAVAQAAQAAATAPASLAAVPARTADVWIAPGRTDGLPGIGTQENPLDGGTRAKFDALWTALPPGVTIHLLPGTFHTWGSYAGQTKEGQIFRGAGMDQTIVVMDKLPDDAAAQTQFFTNFGPINRAAVQHLTLDGNVVTVAPGNTVTQTAGKLVHAPISACYGGYSFVRLRNWGVVPRPQDNGQNPNNIEAFGLWVGAVDQGQGAYPTVLDCIVEPAAGSQTSSVGVNAIAPNLTDPSRIGGLIAHNVVQGRYSEYGIAIAGRFGGLVVRDNLTTRCLRGFHQDTVNAADPGGLDTSVTSEGVSVLDNQFLQSTCGVGVATNGTCNHYRIARNRITLAGIFQGMAGGNVGIYFSGAGPIAGKSNWAVIEGNSIGVDADPAATIPPTGNTDVPGCSIVVSNHQRQVSLLDNTFDPALLPPNTLSPATGSSFLRVAGNRRLDGGDTYPLRDLTVGAQRIVSPFGPTSGFIEDNNTFTLVSGFGDAGGDAGVGANIVLGAYRQDAYYYQGAIAGATGNPGDTVGFPGGLVFYYHGADNDPYGRTLHEGARLDHQGRFGVGTPNPGYTLDVAGVAALRPVGNAPAPPAVGAVLYVDGAGDLHVLHASGTNRVISAH